MERVIEARTRVRAPLDEAAHVLREDPGAVVSDELADGPRQDEWDDREYSTRLATSVGATTVHQEVSVQVGSVVVVSDDEVAVPLSWQPVAHERLLPGFDGRLVVRVDPAGGGELVLSGLYEVPLGAVGRFGDSLIGRRLARQTVSDLLGKLAERLDREVARRLAIAAATAIPYAVELSERPGPESRIS